MAFCDTRSSELDPCQKRPYTVSKETYYSVKRDPLQCLSPVTRDPHNTNSQAPSQGPSLGQPAGSRPRQFARLCANKSKINKNKNKIFILSDPSSVPPARSAPHFPPPPRLCSATPRRRVRGICARYCCETKKLMSFFVNTQVYLLCKANIESTFIFFRMCACRESLQKHGTILDQPLCAKSRANSSARPHRACTEYLTK